MSADPIDIGHGVTVEFVQNMSGVECGLIERHLCNGEPSGGYLAFRHVPQDPGPSWVVEQREPLTLSPSVLCRTCGHHGFIRDGRWEPA